MKKFIERVVLSNGAPLENDLWIDRDDMSMKVFDKGEWNPVSSPSNGGSDDGGSDGGDDIGTFIIPITYDYSIDRLTTSVGVEDIVNAIKEGKLIIASENEDGDTYNYVASYSSVYDGRVEICCFTGGPDSGLSLYEIYITSSESDVDISNVELAASNANNADPYALATVGLVQSYSLPFIVNGSVQDGIFTPYATTDIAQAAIAFEAGRPVLLKFDYGVLGDDAGHATARVESVVYTSYARTKVKYIYLRHKDWEIKWNGPEV